VVVWCGVAWWQLEQTVGELTAPWQTEQFPPTFCSGVPWWISRTGTVWQLSHPVPWFWMVLWQYLQSPA
jgi:hypothetical protein